MNLNMRKYFAVMFFWLSIYTFFGYPNGLPWAQWGLSLSMMLASGFLFSLEKEDAKAKGIVFIEHIKEHLLGELNQDVICKICEKTVEEIYEEWKKKGAAQ